MSCSFPVTLESPPNCILQAFKQSGYYSMLTPDQQSAASQDPAGWLSSHPYLFTVYPNYFSQQAPSTSQTMPWSYNPTSNTSTQYGSGTGSDSSGTPNWMKPFEGVAYELNKFGGWIVDMTTKGIPSLVQAPANALATVIESAGRYPVGALFAIFLIIIIIALIFIVK